MQRAQGFTLIEMVMSMLIIGLLGTAAAMAISYGVRATFETQTRVDTQSDLRLATERLAREIRHRKQRFQAMARPTTDAPDGAKPRIPSSRRQT